jgi:hypothetical protein
MVRAALVVLAACGGGSNTPDAADAVDDAAGLQCGAGTHLENDTCVRDPVFDLRTTATIRADGFTPAVVTVTATNADGTPLHANVVFAVDRASAGYFKSPLTRMDDREGATTFVPCTSATLGCAGPVRFTVALASAPQTPLGHVDAILVAPAPVGSATPCLGGGNVFHYVAQNFGLTGTRTFTPADATFGDLGAPDRGRIQVSNQTEGYNIEANTMKLGIPLIRSVYEDAKGIGLAEPYDPTFAIQNGMFSGVCSASLTQRFQIHEFVYDTTQNRVSKLTATFALGCTDIPTASLTGCVHFSQ